MSEHERSSFQIPLEKVWGFEADGEIIHATAAHGMVIFASKDKRVYALDAASGQQRWIFEMTDKVRRPLIVNDGVLYVFGITGTDERNLYAIDLFTGQKRWKFSARTSTYFRDEMIHIWHPFVKNGVVYIVGDDKTLYAIDAQTGLERWRFSSNKDIGYPTFGYGMVFFGSNDKRVYALDSNSGEKKWEFESGHKNHCCPIVTDGKILIGGDDDLYALDINSGTLLWKIKKILHYGSEHGYGNPPIVFENRVYSSKEFTWIELDSGQIIAKIAPKIKIQNHFYGKNGIHYMVKNFCEKNGILYLQNDGFMDALDLRVHPRGAQIWRTFIEEEIGRILFFPNSQLAGWTISGDHLFATAYHSMETHVINISKPRLHWTFGPYSVPVIIEEMAFVYLKKEMCGYMSSKDPEKLAKYDVVNERVPLLYTTGIPWGWKGQIVWPNCCCICCSPVHVRIDIKKKLGKQEIVFPNVPYCKECIHEVSGRTHKELWGGGFWGPMVSKKLPWIEFYTPEYATMFWIANRLR